MPQFPFQKRTARLFPDPPSNNTATSYGKAKPLKAGWKTPWKLALGLISSTFSWFTAFPALGAERLYVSYGLLERSIPISSLETFAETGEIDEELDFYAQRVTPEQLEQVREVLQTEIPLDVVSVSQFLYSPTGESLLDRLDEVIQTEARQPGFNAIRAALILAADDPQGFTPLAVLQYFPTEGIRIDVAEGLAIADNLQALFNQTTEVVDQVQQQAQLEASNLSLPASLPSVSLQTQGPLQWEMQTLRVSDRQRNRTFPVDFYLPVAPGTTPHPIIVISHGLGSDRSSFEYLARHLASHGFAVAIPAHPGSNAAQLQALLQGTTGNVTRPEEFIDRPLDISDVLDALESLSQSDPALQGRLNLEAIGVMGQSFGGYTALAVAGADLNFQQLQVACQNLDTSLNLSLVLQCLALQLPEASYPLADPRIDAAIAINPVDSKLLGQEGLSQIDVPVMIVAGSADTVTPALPEQFEPFTWLTTSNKYLVLIEGGTHFSIPEEIGNAALNLPEPVIGSAPSLAQRYMQALSLAFFQTYIADEAAYQNFLSAAYANRISQEPLQLSIVRSLPASPSISSTP